MKDNPAQTILFLICAYKEAAGFSIIFFSCRWEDSWLPFVTASSAGSFLSLISIQQRSWSPQESCFIFSLFPLVWPFSSTEDPMSSEPLFWQCTHHLQILAQNEHSKHDFEKCSEALVSQFIANTVSLLWELWSLFVQEIVQMSCRTSALKEKHRKSFSRRKAVRVTHPTQQQSCPSSTATQLPTRTRLTEKEELSMYKEQPNNAHSSESFLRVL